MIKVLLGAAVLLLSVVAVGMWMWHRMTGPLYQPGDVRAGKDVAEPLTLAQAADGRWLVAPDIELYHFEEGAGTPMLVVHGGPGFPPTDPWRAGRLLPCRVIYYHQRGCGLSSRPIRSFSGSNMYENMRQVHRTLGLPAQVGDIERIRRILGVDRLIVIGHSFGAELAALWAAEFPDHVRALVCVAPADLAVLPKKAGDDGDLFDLIRRRLPANMKAEYEQYLADYFNFRRAFARNEEASSAFYGRLAKFWGAAGAPRGDSTVDAAGYEPLGIYCSMGAHHDYRAAFAAVQAPVLVIHGSADLQPESVSRGFAARFTNHQFVSIAGASHFVADEQPEVFAGAVNKFLGGL
ncbi:MAG: alpha/beta hydrolase [Bryobacteraceae bacterium]|jgi:proline iminopeptidase